MTITEDDREWVIENFKWLRDAIGYPKKPATQFLFIEKYFPATFSKPSVEVENVVTDLCALFELKRDVVRIELVTDIRDMPDVPYELGENTFNAETKIKKGAHIIFLANSHQQHPKWMIHCLICELTRIRLVESNLSFEVDGDDTDLFMYLAATYYGFGIMLANSLRYSGRTSNEHWNYVSPMQQPVFAFALAAYAILTNDHKPSWKDELDSDFRKLLESSIDYFNNEVKDLYFSREGQANELLDQSEEYFKMGDDDAALSALQKILFLSDDHYLKSIAYNNIGYHYSMKGEYRQAISNFEKALALSPDFAYPVDNIGYSLIMLGEPDAALSYLEKAMKMEGNDPAYSYRNMALYHARKGDRELAEEFFKKAFSLKTPVDLLEYHYEEFIRTKGR